MIISMLKKFVPLPKIESFKTYLFVGPHPDDIEISSGATVARLVSLGKKVVFAVVTNGCVGGINPNMSVEQLIATRKIEAQKSAKVLGVDDIRMLNFNDGNDYDMAEVSHKLTKLIVEIQPDVVFCPDHTAVNECHPDHLNVGKCTTDAYFFSMWDKITQRMNIEGVATPSAIAYYYTDKPNCYVKVSKTLKQKFEAIRCHTSQFDQQGFKMLELYNKLSTFRHGAKSFKGRAEAFRVLANVHQHCFPEVAKY